MVTAGGAQALVKASSVVPGSRVAFAGSGPLALAFPAQLRHYGVNVVLVLEAGPPPGPRALLGLARAAAGNRELLRDAAGYRWQLTRYRVPRGTAGSSSPPKATAGSKRSCTPRSTGLAGGAGSQERVAVDTLCLGYGFVPSDELLRLAGCAFGYDEDLGGAVVGATTGSGPPCPACCGRGRGGRARRAVRRRPGPACRAGRRRPTWAR